MHLGYTPTTCMFQASFTATCSDMRTSVHTRHHKDSCTQNVVEQTPTAHKCPGRRLFSSASSPSGNQTLGWGHAHGETAAGRPWGACVFWGGSCALWGKEAPRAPGLFCWKLVRINSLACTPLCPAEVDKHDWSRSDTSPRGKKRKAAWSASLCRGARVKLVLYVPVKKTKNKHTIRWINLLKKHISTLTILYKMKQHLSDRHQNSCIGFSNIASLTCCYSGRRFYFRKQLPNKALLPKRTSPAFPPHPHVHSHKNRLDYMSQISAKLQNTFCWLQLGFVCPCDHIGNLRSRPLIEIVL